MVEINTAHHAVASPAALMANELINEDSRIGTAP